MNIFQHIFALALVSVATAGPIFDYTPIKQYGGYEGFGEYTKGFGGVESYDGAHLENYEIGALGFGGALDGGYESYGQDGAAESHGFGGIQDGGYENYGHGESVESYGKSEDVESFEHGGSAGGYGDLGTHAAFESYSHGGAGGGHDDGHGHEDYHAHPAYSYEYGVKDPKTGDHKSAWEHRDGDKVVGEYSLDEADGTKRVVSYTSDKKNGFQAVVKKIGHSSHSSH